MEVPVRRKFYNTTNGSRMCIETIINGLDKMCPTGCAMVYPRSRNDSSER
jgi:hypothetical protein